MQLRKRLLLIFLLPLLGQAVPLQAQDKPGGAVKQGAPKWEPGDFITVRLKCPTENGGVLEVVLRRDDGEITIRNRITYVGGKAKFTSVAGARKTDRFQELPVSEEILLVTAKSANALKKNVCEASPEQRARYYSLMKSGSPLLQKYEEEPFDYQSVREKR